MEISPSASGVQTFLNANQRVQDSATQIAKSSVNGSSADLASSITDLKVAEQEASAAVKIIQAEDSQIGSILNVLA